MENRGWTGLPSISKTMYQATYFLEGEDYNAWCRRMSSSFSNDPEHASRIYGYLQKYWFHPSTPISSNGGTDNGLPISCYVGDVEDSKQGIFDSWNESGWLGSNAGGIGRYWGNVRESGAEVGQHGGKSSGIIPFMCVDGALTRAISQGNIRRMSQADYIETSHPEIVEFLEIRKPTGDQNRRDQDLHHGVSISDAFMEAVIADDNWNLISPKTGEVVETIKARLIWNKILEMRITTGEPYLFFYDNVNRLAPSEYKTLGLDIHLSNLCTEIMLNTSPTKTNVCCLASINLEYWDEFKDELDTFVADCTDFLDNVIQDFIDRTEGHDGFKNARNAALEERALGLGVMGFHSLLQKKNIPFESAIAKGLNINIFKSLRKAADKHQEVITTANPDLICPMSLKAGTKKRNIVTLAVAPTMSISNLCNLASSGIEPWISNAFTKKLKQGSFAIRNKFLEKVIVDYANKNIVGTPDPINTWIEEQWQSIKKNEGSVQHLDWMDDYTKAVFKTAFEIDQKWLIEHAANRTEYIDQGQSLNLFIIGNSHIQAISDLHIMAWKKGIKSLYYNRSTNPNRASTASKDRQTIQTSSSGTNPMDEGCIGCQ